MTQVVIHLSWCVILVWSEYRIGIKTNKGNGVAVHDRRAILKFINLRNIEETFNIQWVGKLI